MKVEITLVVRKKIGGKIRRARQKKNLSLRQLEAITGIGHSWLGKLENGNVNFQIDSLINLCEALQIQPKNLFSFNLEFPEQD